MSSLFPKERFGLSGDLGDERIVKSVRKMYLRLSCLSLFCTIAHTSGPQKRYSFLLLFVDRQNASGATLVFGGISTSAKPVHPSKA